MMKIKPLGFYIIVEMEKVTTGGVIELPEDIIAKEQDATSVGYVRAIGPTAYCGYPGCDENIELTEGEYRNTAVTVRKEVKPHECWGLEIGQKIEYRKFEGKKSAVKGYENYRYIPDSHIIGAIEDE